MAGRKQHFIPQALQRGFGVAKGKKTQVYVFKKGQEPYHSSTEGVAAQRDFWECQNFCVRGTLNLHRFREVVEDFMCSIS